MELLAVLVSPGIAVGDRQVCGFWLVRVARRTMGLETEVQSWKAVLEAMIALGLAARFVARTFAMLGP